MCPGAENLSASCAVSRAHLLGTKGAFCVEGACLSMCYINSLACHIFGILLKSMNVLCTDNLVRNKGMSR